MNATLDSVEAAALQLSTDDRRELIERLLEPVLPAELLHPAWEAEIARRVTEVDAGLVECIPFEQVLAKTRATIEAHRQPK